MKHLFLFNAYSVAAAYGVGTYIRQLTDCLNASGIELTVVYIRASRPLVAVEIENGVRYLYIPAPRFADRVDPGRNNACFSRSIACLLKPYVTNPKETAFHLNFMHDQVLCRLLKKIFACRVILTVHYAEWAFPLFGNKKRFLEILSTPHEKLSTPQEKDILAGKESTARFLADCDHIIVVACHEAQTLKEIYGVPESKIVVINNALKDVFEAQSTEERMKCRDDFYIDPDEKIILFAGRLDKMKGFPILLKAFELLLKKDKKIRLLAVGGGDYQGSLEKADRFWSKISFTGFLSKDILFRLYTVADVGVVPSMYEEFGYVAIEMMMHGLPVIANKTTGLEEIVDDGITGLYVPLSDDESRLPEFATLLADRIANVLYDDVVKREMARYARDKFLRKYEEKLFKENMLRFYHSVC